MRRSAVGGTAALSEAEDLLTPDWHKALSEKQLVAYIRHAYIWRQSGATELESPSQTKRNPRWDGGQDAYGVKFTAVWPRIARMVRAVDADPGTWIAAHFSPCGIEKFVQTSGSFEAPDIIPSNLCGAQSEKIYNEYCSKFPKTTIDAYNAAGRAIALRLRSVEKLPVQMSLDERRLCVICDEGYVSAPPFIRQGFANAFNLPDAIARYCKPAAFEYEAKQRLYERVIPDFLPAWLISNQVLDTVKAIRTHWRRYEQLGR